MKNAFALRLLLLAAGLPILLPACARQSYQAQHSGSVHTVVVAEQVLKPQQMHYRDLSKVLTDKVGGAAVGVAFGIVGGVIYQASTHNVSRRSGRNLEETMTLNGIRIDEIVRRATSDEMARSGLFPGGAGLQRTVVSGQPDAVMTLEVEEYGFGQSGFLKRGLVPVLKVEGQLVRASDRKELWKESVEVDTHNHYANPHLYEEYRTNPALIREAFDIAAHAVAADMVRNMKGEKEKN